MRIKEKACFLILSSYILLSVQANAQVSERDLEVTESILRFIFSERDAKEASQIAELKKKQKEIENGTYTDPSPKDPFFDGSFLDDIKEIEMRSYFPLALNVQGVDPPKAFTKRLSSKKHPLVSKKAFMQWPEDDQSFRVQVATGKLKPPILFSVTKIEEIPLDILIVDVVKYCGPLHGDFYKYKLEKEGSEWVVVEANHWGAS
ncbi:MAG: hypothetical protein ACSHX8_04800 [Opitutaceae bacterium]